MRKPTLPRVVQRFVKHHIKILVWWFSNYLMEMMIDEQPEHHLVTFNKVFDFGPLAALCQGFYKDSTRGKGIDHTPERLCRALYVKYHFDYSFRQAEEAIRNHVLIRWFVGYSFHESTPDHTTIHSFEDWMRTNHPDAFHLALMGNIDQQFPQEQELPQIGDTFACHANAAAKQLPDLLRDGCRQILNLLVKLDWQLHLTIYKLVDISALFGAKKERATVFLGEPQFKRRLEQTARATLAFLELIRTNWHLFAHLLPQERQKVIDLVANLEKILHDDLIIEYLPDHQVSIKKRDKNKKGTYRIRSVTDPDATYRVHDDKINFGYNVSVLATTNFVREIIVATGAEPDAKALEPLIINHQAHYGFYPSKIIYDRAAGTGKQLAIVEQASQGQTQLVVKLIDYDKRTKRFKPTDFELSEDALSLTCPNGQTTHRKYRHGAGDGYSYRFMPPMCASCPLKTRLKCRGKSDIPTGTRNVFISDYLAPRQKALAYNRTPTFKKDMRFRNNIERVIAGLVLHNGARTAKVRGLKKVQFQITMNAFAYNAKRFIKLLTEQKKSISGCLI